MGSAGALPVQPAKRQERVGPVSASESAGVGHGEREPSSRPTRPTLVSPMDYDAELRLHNEVLRRACRIRPGDHVLDIGCGTGLTTREAARMAHAAGSVGVDTSAPAIERARDLARAAGLRNITFKCVDAQVHRFASGFFDVAISRFGTMFFHDPAAAFANIGRALRPAGRLVMMVWQAGERNEWEVAIRDALAGPDGPTMAAGEGPDPFSLADPTTVEAILRAAGFGDVIFTDVSAPVYYGPDRTAACDWVRGFTSTREYLKRLDPTAAALAIARLNRAFGAHLSDSGVWFNSRAWLITARRN
jgi:SAM-dependent methyltransferase